MSQEKIAASKKKRAASAGQSVGAMYDEPFPPLSTSLATFLEDGSDLGFRQVIYNVLTVSALMLRVRERFASYIGVTGPQYSILVAVGEVRSATVSQIAQQQHVSSSFITAEVGKLVRRGYLERSPNLKDGRSALLSLTNSGMGLITQLGEYRRLANDTVFGSFDKEQAKIFSAHMERLVVDAERALHMLDAPEWKLRAHIEPDK